MSIRENEPFVASRLPSVVGRTDCKYKGRSTWYIFLTKNWGKMSVKPLSDSSILIKPSMEMKKFIDDMEMTNPNFDGVNKTHGKLLNLENVKEMYDLIQRRNKATKDKIYLHVLLEGSSVIYPRNEIVVRNPDLERRCLNLRMVQENLCYQRITRHISNARIEDDTVGNQLKQINKYLIAVIQVVFSVIAGFAFGFTGINLILGEFDVRSRLLMGVICGFIIAIAELYFLVRNFDKYSVVHITKT
ncbi:hypothetical protein JTB14_010351 [Gonioctena quinquepunctata]|nr:hypothetical protein JTB14_010351 [Gonioctena quinquepunctata]